VLVDTTEGAVTITLPTTATTNIDLHSVIIKRVAGGNNVTINRSSTNTITTDGVTATSRTLGSVGASWTGVAVNSKTTWYTYGTHGTIT
jgi:hypothetical protein